MPKNATLHNGSAQDFGSCCGGSSPSVATNN